MTKEELQARIEKKQKDIEKIEKRLSKWTMKKDSEKEFEKAYSWLNTFEQRKNDFKKEWIEDCEKEIRGANRDLAEANETIKKYQNQIEKINEFNNTEKIKVIWDFLQEWRKNAYKFFVENIKLYAKLQAEEAEKWKGFKETPEYKNHVTINRNGSVNDWVIHNNFRKEYYEPIHNLTKEVYKYNGKWDDARLNMILDRDVQAKYNTLKKQVEEKAGEIIDASNLYIDDKGNIAGTIKGSKNTVNLWTSLSGGYNVQCLHFRSYCNVAK